MRVAGVDTPIGGRAGGVNASGWGPPTCPLSAGPSSQSRPYARCRPRLRLLVRSGRVHCWQWRQMAAFGSSPAPQCRQVPSRPAPGVVASRATITKPIGPSRKPPQVAARRRAQIVIWSLAPWGGQNISNTDHRRMASAIGASRSAVSTRSRWQDHFPNLRRGLALPTGPAAWDGRVGRAAAPLARIPRHRWPAYRGNPSRRDSGPRTALGQVSGAGNCRSRLREGCGRVQGRGARPGGHREPVCGRAVAGQEAAVDARSALHRRGADNGRRGTGPIRGAGHHGRRHRTEARRAVRPGLGPRRLSPPNRPRRPTTDTRARGGGRPWGP
jgi:hypothetical protein